MKKIDFFDPSCKESERTETRFGIRDDKTNSKAYTDISNPSEWGATVCNPNNISISFFAIDKCINNIPYSNKVCDAMLIFPNGLYLVELKNQKRRGVAKALKQLVSIILLVLEHHKNKLDNIKDKRAYACNKKHPHAKSGRAGDFQTIYEKTGFKIYTKSMIGIGIKIKDIKKLCDL